MHRLVVCLFPCEAYDSAHPRSDFDIAAVASGVGSLPCVAHEVLHFEYEVSDAENSYVVCCWIGFDLVGLALRRVFPTPEDKSSPCFPL
jgi:hypothetical protein